MTHFDRTMWTLFTQDKIDKKTYDEMMQHLECCTQCLETYMSTVEDTCRASAEILISPEFTDTVMSKVETRAVKSYPVNKPVKVSKPPNVFVYYAAAACITLILSFSGAFQFLLDDVPKTSGKADKPRSGVEKIFLNGWSDRLTNITKNLINKIN